MESFLLAISLGTAPQCPAVMSLTLTPTFRSRLGALFAMVGTFLLAVSITGHFTSYGKGLSYRKRIWERFQPSLVSEVRDYRTLEMAIEVDLALKAPSPAEKMRVMLEHVEDRFTHKEAEHTLASNWILYLAGGVHPTFRHVWDPEKMVSHGYSLLCDQAAYLLLHLAEKHGIKARQVGLQGHVVMEAWYEGGWHLYDPDLEVIPVDAQGKVLSLQELARNEELLTKYYGPHEMADLIRHTENHLLMEGRPGSRFEWKGNLLAIFERVTEVLKFVIPVLLLMGGLWLVRSAIPMKKVR